MNTNPEDFRHQFLYDAIVESCYAIRYTESRTEFYRAVINYLSNLRDGKDSKTLNFEIERIANTLIKEYDQCPFCDTTEPLVCDSFIIDNENITILMCQNCDFDIRVGEDYKINPSHFQ